MPQGVRENDLPPLQVYYFNVTVFRQDNEIVCEGQLQTPNFSKKERVLELNFARLAYHIDQVLRVCKHVEVVVCEEKLQVVLESIFVDEQVASEAVQLIHPVFDEQVEFKISELQAILA